MPNLLCIDGIPVSGDEKAKAEMYFIEQQVNNNSKTFIAHSPAGLFGDTRQSCNSLSSIYKNNLKKIKIT